MYKIFIKNLEGFEKIFTNDERLNIAKPLYLLKDIGIFNRHKVDNSIEYRNLYEIMKKAEECKNSTKYHSFGMFLNELHLQHFEFHEPACNDIKISDEMLEYQLSLLCQFMFPAYYLN
jgi:hypothetical protein